MNSQYFFYTWLGHFLQQQNQRDFTFLDLELRKKQEPGYTVQKYAISQTTFLVFSCPGSRVVYTSQFPQPTCSYVAPNSNWSSQGVRPTNSLWVGGNWLDQEGLSGSRGTSGVFQVADCPAVFLRFVYLHNKYILYIYQYVKQLNWAISCVRLGGPRASRGRLWVKGEVRGVP